MISSHFGRLAVGGKQDWGFTIQEFLLNAFFISCWIESKMCKCPRAEVWEVLESVLPLSDFISEEFGDRFASTTRQQPLQEWSLELFPNSNTRSSRTLGAQAYCPSPHV